MDSGAKNAVPSSPEARRRMRANRRRDTKPEVELRRELHRRGRRFRVDYKVLPRRRVDIVFISARVAVFVDGCFWHGCPDHGTSAKANADFWRTKIRMNQLRDADSDARLTELGWAVLHCWEHEPASDAADRVEALLASRLPH